MTCRECGLVKAKDTKKYFIPNRSGHCRGCYRAIYHHRGYIGQRLTGRPPRVKIKVRSLNGYEYAIKVTKTYAHTSVLTGRDFSRERVRRRDNYTCQSCGKVWQEGLRRLDVHHLEGLCGKLSKSYDRVGMMPKLITLCHKCHFNQPTHTLGRQPVTINI